MAAGGKTGQVLVWILMAMLILGLGGFGITNFGGSVRRIGTVEGQDISTEDYFRALRNDLNALSAQVRRPLGFAEALAMGLDASVRQRLVTTAVLDAEAARLGISVGDARLAQEIRAIPAFHNMSGSFDRTAYAMTLQDNGWKEAQFETQTRRDLSRSLLQTAVATGFAGSDAAAAAYYDYIEERRSFSVLRLTEADLEAPLAEPDDAALRAYYDAHPDQFTRPQTRRITYAALLADDVAKVVPVDEAELRKLYDQRINEFVQPERRLLERLVFSDDDAATAARNRLDAGQISFEALVQERGLTLNDVDMGDIAKADLGAAGDPIFEMAEPGIIGPLPSPLGPALFRMNGILAADEVTFDEAREALTSEFALDAARRQIRTRVNEIDDLLAGGATLEDLAGNAGLVLATIDMEPGTTDGIAAYPRFRDEAAKITDRDFPQVIELDDGSLVAMRLDEILAPALRPYDEVASQVAEAALTDALKQALAARLAEVQAQVGAGTAMGAFGIVEVAQAMPRGGRIDAAPADLVQQVFDLETDEVAPVVTDDFVGLIRLDRILAADHSTPEAEQWKQMLKMRQGQELGQDAFALFASALEQRAKITLDEGAIAAVHSQMR
ncbi:peptidyl-prolyl cis-trans isomerase D [Gemmobacter megaterium]|uniref:Peptidyl-prolyl cis-trans isomerase D n=1 Tax=Gemmobacter megaterium TaxID=1086013 RepID=A0A1N7Q6X9_9RHOB|nr:peptidyl-prolyl cis-trans isomerase [Gemmobacter megaterium]GGE23626.1 peptidyl-prolyl cis-trans isomerase [Gemmobacter megaterium]SIT18603.1 peptidyl-prolyl cis-trans isomerase D [Gemmobacter megaterium]